MSDLSTVQQLAQPRVVRSPRGTQISCRNWLIEAAYRMLQNNLDPEVAENPDALVVYGGIGKAARNWDCFEAICKSLRELKEDETLLVQSGKPVGVFRTHVDAPRVLIANSNLVPKWATWEHFHELDRKGLMMYGQMTAGSWIYIGSQGIVQGTYETFVEAGRQHFGGSMAGRWILTAGLGGMGGAQPLAATFAGACSLNIECQQSRHRLPPAHALPRRAGHRSGRRAGAHRQVHGAEEGRLDRPARQRIAGPAGAGETCTVRRHQARPGHRPDQRARSRQRLPARGLERGQLESRASRCRPAQRAARRRGEELRGARAGHARLPGDGHSDRGLRQQHPPGGLRRRREERLRLPRLRAGLRAPAVLPGQGPVPLGGAVAAIRRTSARPTRR